MPGGVRWKSSHLPLMALMDGISHRKLWSSIRKKNSLDLIRRDTPLPPYGSPGCTPSQGEFINEVYQQTESFCSKNEKR